MDQFNFHSRKMLLEAVCSAEDAAIQLRRYAAATLPPVREILEISGDVDLPASIEIAAEDWLRMELPCVMPRREDNDRSRFLAGLLRNAIHRAFPKHDQPRFRTCVLVYEHIYDLSQSRPGAEALSGCPGSSLSGQRHLSALLCVSMQSSRGTRQHPHLDADAGAVSRMAEEAS